MDWMRGGGGAATVGAPVTVPGWDFLFSTLDLAHILVTTDNEKTRAEQWVLLASEARR